MRPPEWLCRTYLSRLPPRWADERRSYAESEGSRSPMTADLVDTVCDPRVEDHLPRDPASEGRIPAAAQRVCQRFAKLVEDFLTAKEEIERTRQAEERGLAH